MDKHMDTDQPPNYSVEQDYQKQQQNYDNNTVQGPHVQMPQPAYPQQQQQQQQQQTTFPQYQQTQASYQPLQPQQQSPNYGFNNNLIQAQPSAQPNLRPQQQQQPLFAYNNGQPIPIRPITFDNTDRLKQMQEPVTLEKRLRENYPRKYAKAQGIILIIIGIIQLGTESAISNRSYISSKSGIWGGLFYIATGIVTLLLNSKRTIRLFYATMVMHIIGFIIGIVVLILNLQSRTLYLFTDGNKLYLILIATGAICSALCLIKVVAIIIFICNLWCFKVDNRHVNVNYYN